MKLQNKVAIVTGAGSGIGKAIAKGFASEGARVACADISLVAAEKTAQEISESGKEAIPVIVDVSVRSQVELMVSTVLEHWHRLDVMVAAAGIGPVGRFLEITDEQWDRVLGVNLKGMFLCGQAAARHMAKAGGGVIINITSQVADIAQPDCAHYYASKGGGKQLTKAMAIDLAPFKIRVNALAPGLTNTGMTKISSDEGWSYRKKILEHIPLGRPAEPEEMVGGALFLASDDSLYMTGASLVIDGGYQAM